MAESAIVDIRRKFQVRLLDIQASTRSCLSLLETRTWRYESKVWTAQGTSEDWAESEFAASTELLIPTLSYPLSYPSRPSRLSPLCIKKHRIRSVLISRWTNTIEPDIFRRRVQVVVAPILDSASRQPAVAPLPSLFEFLLPSFYQRLSAACKTLGI